MERVNIYFWVIPILYLALAVVFYLVARNNRESTSAAMAARAFAIALASILVETQHGLLSRSLVGFAVPLHWLAIICTLEAFLLRQGKHMPRHAWWLFAFGVIVNLIFAFILPNVGVRASVSQIVGALLIAIAVPPLWRYRRGLFDRAIAWVALISLVCYVVRLLLFLLWGYGSGRSPLLPTTPFTTVFYFTSGIVALMSAMLLLLAITADLIERHYKTAMVDALTGLGNRHALDRVANRHKDGSDVMGAVLILDLDHFKSVNDAHGHAMGDAVLRAAAQTIQSAAGSFGHMVRLGGEELAVLVRADHADAAPQLADVLCQLLALQHVGSGDGLVPITVSIGVAWLAADEILGEGLRRADIALYAAKNGGRNRVVLENVDAPGRQCVTSPSRFAWI